VTDEETAKDDLTGIRERMRMGPVVIMRDPDGTWRSDETDAYGAAMLANQTGPPEAPKAEGDPGSEVKP
jgi:hypothetical protein